VKLRRRMRGRMNSTNSPQISQVNQTEQTYEANLV